MEMFLMFIDKNLFDENTFLQVRGKHEERTEKDLLKENDDFIGFTRGA